MVEREHVRFFGTEQDIVGKILHDLGDQQQSASHLLGGRSRNKSFDFWGHDGRAEEAQEYKSSHSGVLCIWKTRLDCLRDLNLLAVRQFRRVFFYNSLTMLQTLRNELGMLEEDAQISSTKTLVTI